MICGMPPLNTSRLASELRRLYLCPNPACASAEDVVLTIDAILAMRLSQLTRLGAGEFAQGVLQPEWPGAMGPGDPGAGGPGEGGSGPGGNGAGEGCSGRDLRTRRTWRLRKRP